jgi:ABC-type nitrate/sulfonate/bicarbonate transport system substrate-binding protein
MSVVGKSAVLAAVLVLVGTGLASAQGLKLWKHGVIKPKGDGGFMLMVGQRDFAKKHGLKVQIVELKNGAIAHKALLAGEVDSIESSPGAAILAGARGADIKIVGCDWPGMPHGLMAGPKVHTMADLKGKTVAVASPGSLPNLLIKAMLDKYKVPANEVHFANLGGDRDRYKAVVAGVADAGIVAAEFMAIAPKNIHMLMRGHEVLPNYVRLCLSMTGKTIAARREDAINFAAAEIDAMHYAVTHRDATIAVTHAAIHDKANDPRPAFAYDDSLKHGLVDADMPLPLDKLKWMVGALRKAGNLKTDVDLAKITAPDIRNAAAKRAGK